MYKKRDGMVVLYLQRSSENVLLFPFVYFMAGEASAYGDAVELAAPVASAVIGKQIVRLLRACKKADVDGMKDRRMERLRSYWRGESATKDQAQGEASKQLLKKYPVLGKGPGAYLRQFAVCQVVEREGWNHRKVVRVEQSKYRGCTTDGDVERVPITETPRELGSRVLGFLAG